MHELLDIVDANDEVLGCATRTEVHRTRRMHRAVHMLVFNAAGEVFLQQRAPNKEQNPSRWDSSAAGHVDSGEDYGAAAVRELEEELSIRHGVSELTEFMRRTPTADNGFEHQRFYALLTDQSLSLCAAEISDGRWLTPSELDSRVAAVDISLTPDLSAVWPVYRSRAAEVKP